jgi:HPt (histidine-containing phosphotransfer) domain-containing protein
VEQLVVSEEAEEIIDWAAFSNTRAELGAEFVRILGYFREDGVKSVVSIEDAMRAADAAAMVVPAHTLKGEASQFGAEALADLAENIETIARQSVEWRQTPDEALPDVVKLRALFDETLLAFERETNPLVERRAFGRKTEAANQRFGQI